MQADNKKPILVTGASGYIASHLIKLLLESDYKVRGTVRSVANKEKNSFIYELVPDKKNNLELIEADLTQKECWLKAVEGCDYVFHVASPIPAYVPKDEMEIIGPAVAGTVNVLDAALAKGVKKVIVTSSCLAIMIGNEKNKILTEENWSNEAICPAYPKSKVKAERAAWDFYEKNKNKIHVTVVNPSMVMGPIYNKHGNSSETLLAEIVNGRFPGVPDVKVGLADVRDVAVAHYNAMFSDKTNGKRFICSGDGVSLESIISALKLEFDKYGYSISDKKITADDIVASGNPVAQRLLPLIGTYHQLDNSRSVKELNMKYRPMKDTVVDMAYSLIKYGVISDKTKSK